MTQTVTSKPTWSMHRRALWLALACLALGIGILVAGAVLWLSESAGNTRRQAIDDELREALQTSGGRLLARIDAEIGKGPKWMADSSSGAADQALTVAERLMDVEELAWKLTSIPGVRQAEFVWPDGYLRLSETGTADRQLEVQLGPAVARAYRQRQPGDRTHPKLASETGHEIAWASQGSAAPAGSSMPNVAAWRALSGSAQPAGIDADMQRVLARSDVGVPLLMLRVRLNWVKPEDLARLLGVDGQSTDLVLLSADPQGVVRASEPPRGARVQNRLPQPDSAWVRLEWPLSGWQLAWRMSTEAHTRTDPRDAVSLQTPSSLVLLLLTLGLAVTGVALALLRMRLRLRRDLALLSYQLRTLAEPQAGVRLVASTAKPADGGGFDSEEFRLLHDLSRAAVQVREQVAAAAARDASGSIIVRQAEPTAADESLEHGPSGASLIELKRAHPIQQALRDARAQLRETKAAFHKLQGRTSAEIASQQRLIEESQRLREEVESRYLAALQEIDQLRSQVSRARSRQSVVVKFKPLQILLIEGNPISRQLFEGALLKLRMRADVVTTLEEAASAMQQLEYQAVIVGSSAPSSESQRTLDALRECFQGKRRPMLIWLERATARESALDPWPTGIDAILPTPLRLSDLRHVLDRAALGDALPAAEQLAATTLEPMLNAATLAQHKVLDDEAPEPFMREVIEQFASSIPNVIEEALRLAADAQWDRLARVIHKLRGTSLTLGAERLERQCKLLEVASDEANAEQVLALLDDFETLARGTSEALLAAALDFRSAASAQAA